MFDIYSILEQLNNSTTQYIASIIQVTGSSYRKEGASMLINHDGSFVGVLSGGCLEADLFERIKINAERSSWGHTYDLKAEDDLLWGHGIGCNGVIQVLVEKVDKALKMNLLKFKEKLDQGVNVKVIKKISREFKVIDYLFICSDGNVFGVWSTDYKPELLEKLENGTIFDDESSVYYYSYLYRARPNLLIFGAGPDAIPLASLAKQNGYQVSICDWRSAYCNRDCFPSADQLVLGNPFELISKVNLKETDAAVIMTHHFQKDKEILTHLLTRNLRYLGILGSLNRTKRLVGGIDLPDWVHYPVGLNIHAEGPFEIAISIMAEIIKNQKHPLLNKEIMTI